MRAQIVRLHSPDQPDLAHWRPADPSNAGALVQIIAAPEGEQCEESFDVVVGTRSYLDRLPPQDRELEVPHWDFDLVSRLLLERVRVIEGDTWRQVAEQLNVFARWEFDQYRPFEG
jgi:hypothetical protein